MHSYKKIICENCGKTAFVPKIRRINVCTNPECERIVRENHRKLAKEKFADKQRELKKQNELINEQQVEEEKVEEKDKKIDTTAYDNTSFSDIRELARELGSIRYQLIEALEKEKKLIEMTNEEDNSFLIHYLEFEDFSETEIYNKCMEVKERRVKRRSAKYRSALIKKLLNSIKIKTPERFVVQAINGCKKTRDFEKYLEELSKDETYFSK